MLVIEIGVKYGGSVQWLRDQLPKSYIIGIDMEESCAKYRGERLGIMIGRQEDVEFLNTVPDKIDVIIDDGGHRMNQQQITLKHLFRKLEPSGLYFIEDLHTSTPAQAAKFNKEGAVTTLDVIKSLISGEFIDTPFLTPEDMRYIKDNSHSIELSCDDRLATFIRKS